MQNALEMRTLERHNVSQIVIMLPKTANNRLLASGEFTTTSSTRLFDRRLPMPRGLETLIKCLHRYVEVEASRFEVVERGGGENCVKLVLLKEL